MNRRLHIAIIMDGNGRWARQRHLPRLEGHRRGVETVKRIVEAADELGIHTLTLYSFSTENWKRPEKEVIGLMNLFRFYVRNNLKELTEKNVRIRIIGSRDGLDEDILDWIEKAEQETSVNDGLNLCLAFNYGAKHEIASAAFEVLQEARDGKINPEAITPDLIESHLKTKGLPDPDMVIRTSGERRISNFLLWQARNADLYFTDVLWPNFQKKDLETALVQLAANRAAE